MQIAKVMGSATSTIKHPSLVGWKLLLVRMLAADGCSSDGDPLLAVDAMGAAVGQRVILTSDGHSTRELVGDDRTPIRWTVMGICD
ncbi:MAG: EutN/CcmL family microcompartment protein [Planctomycetales bacterium]